jgi:hypothetical protein
MSIAKQIFPGTKIDEIVYTQQYDKDFLSKISVGQPIYFSNSPTYWSSNSKHVFQAVLNAQNVINLLQLKKELEPKHDNPNLSAYEIHDELISKARGITSSSSTYDSIIRDAYHKGGVKLMDDIDHRFKTADVIIGPESTFGDAPTAYVVFDPKNIRLLNRSANNPYANDKEEYVKNIVNEEVKIFMKKFMKNS